MTGNVLLVGKNLTFPQAMRVSEGMSYKHDEIFIKARGKQIQRAVEIAAMLVTRDRGEIQKTDIGSEVNDDGIRICSIQINLSSHGVAKADTTDSFSDND